MRTTIRLDEHLLKEAKTVAVDTGRTLTGVIEDALRESLARRRTAAQRERVTLRTFKGGTVQPGVDLTNSAALLDLMEGRDASP